MDNTVITKLVILTQILLWSFLGASTARAQLVKQGVSPAEYEVTIEEAFISMPDGVRLAADLYMPTPAHSGAHPAR